MISRIRTYVFPNGHEQSYNNACPDQPPDASVLVSSVSLNDADLYCINHIASPVDLCAGWSFSGHRKLTTIPRNYGLLTVYERIRIFMSRSLF